MHMHILMLYGASSQGKLTKMFFTEAYSDIRTDPRNALPPPYLGQYPPKPKFTSGCPAPVIMWPHNPEAQDEPFWPQNGTPRISVFCPVFKDWFGLEWRNVYVYKAN